MMASTMLFLVGSGGLGTPTQVSAKHLADLLTCFCLGVASPCDISILDAKGLITLCTHRTLLSSNWFSTAFAQIGAKAILCKRAAFLASTLEGPVLSKVTLGA